MTLNRPYLTLTMLHTTIYKLDGDLELRYSTPHCTAVILNSILPILFSEPPLTSLQAQYVHIICNHLLRKSSTAHHHCATQPHPAIKFDRSEVSRDMHHFSANSRNNIEICWLEWADTHITPRCNLNPLSWKLSPKMSRHTYHSKCSQNWISSKFIIESEPYHALLRTSIVNHRSSAMLRVSYSRPHSIPIL